MIFVLSITAWKSIKYNICEKYMLVKSKSVLYPSVIAVNSFAKQEVKFRLHKLKCDFSYLYERVGTVQYKIRNGTWQKLWYNWKRNGTGKLLSSIGGGTGGALIYAFISAILPLHECI